MEPVLSYAGYELVFEDHFNEAELDRNRWTVELHEPGWVNAELQEYVDSEDTISLEGGALRIRPLRTVHADGRVSYTSGRISTLGRRHFTYGLFESRLKVPKGKGFLPAFWLMTADEKRYGAWPACGEIDMMEIMGDHTRTNYGTIHYGLPHEENQGVVTLTEGDFSEEYHDFALQWEPGVLRWYVDGRLFHEAGQWYSAGQDGVRKPFPAPFDHEMYIILNLAVGGTWVGYPDETTDFEHAVFAVDYVRVYQKTQSSLEVTAMKDIRFLDEDGTFAIDNPEEVSGLYFPLASETGLKSAVTPGLGGDCKLDQETFLLEPACAEDLRNSRAARNFWCVLEDGCWSAIGGSAEQEAVRFTEEQDESRLTAGLMWQTVCRETKRYELRAEITSFVPHRENTEIMTVRVINTGHKPRRVTGVAAIPIYGRSADNVRDHRNVTSMLHRIRTVEHGVLVKPTMSFDEKGHRVNHRIYYVLGAAGDGSAPAGFYPTVDAFLGEGGTFLRPRAVYEGAEGAAPGVEIDGREAMGGIRFPAVVLEAGRSAEYIVLLGVSEDRADIDRVLSAFGTAERVRSALDATRAYWQEQVNVRYQTGSPDFDRLMRWISFQPFLRRIYGCSFLPHHDYGRGGRGWRDLWQDCLSLLLLDPSGVGEMIRANFGGVRVDGTNATIIGDGDGNFIADRNGIARVWMDHAVWPLMTTKLYIDQTGDFAILNAKVPYFKDGQTMRGEQTDRLWDEGYGNRQRTEDGAVYKGSILEHLLIQHLAAFYEVGAHNIFRLRGADWNDALDMASEYGESVAFTCAYAGNLRQLAALLRELARRSVQDTVCLMEELRELLEEDPGVYTDIARKTAVLERYMRRCAHNISGRTVAVSLAALAGNLDGKADWLMEHIRGQEWIEDGEDGWFNSYYDNSRRPLEGITETGVRMMLTGQVFAIMSGTATDSQARAITRSADRYLYQKEAGGYRLNTDFHELKFDMGRMFGFAYGEKENGAVFSHMTVMYANALYRRGLVREGYRALQTLAETALDFQTSRIFPGIPEYFNAEGRGMYHYLTGAASWYMLTVITEVFGVQGEGGDLVIAPKLVREQFDASGKASIELPFAGKQLRVVFSNLAGKDFGAYRIGTAAMAVPDAPQIHKLTVSDGKVTLPRGDVLSLPERGTTITVELL